MRRIRDGGGVIRCFLVNSQVRTSAIEDSCKTRQPAAANGVGMAALVNQESCQDNFLIHNQ